MNTRRYDEQREGRTTLADDRIVGSTYGSNGGPGPQVMAADTLKGDDVVNAAEEDLGKIEHIMSQRPYRVRRVLWRLPWHGRQAIRRALECTHARSRKSSVHPRCR
jgi:hypothetical protein